MSFFNAPSISSTSLAQPTAPVEKDVEVANPPTDSVSSLSFSPQADYLAVASWDNNVYIHEVGMNGQTQGKAMYSHSAPVLSVCWNKEGNKVLSGGVDNAGRMFDLVTGQSSQVAQHDAPIKCVKWIEGAQGSGFLATGSWDKTVKYWDLRTSAPVATVTLPERCYAMDVVHPLMVVGTAERHIQVFHLDNPTTVFQSTQSPLKMQTRVITCFPNARGYAIGSVEGRVGVQNLDEKDAGSNYTFRCHRREGATKNDSLVYAVNDMSFHPVHGSLSTSGSDGVMNFWDLDARTRLKTFEPQPGPLSATCFNRTGTIFAYSVSYDWHKGHSGAAPGHVNKVLLHHCKDDEVKKKPVKR